GNRANSTEPGYPGHPFDYWDVSGGDRWRRLPDRRRERRPTVSRPQLAPRRHGVARTGPAARDATTLRGAGRGHDLGVAAAQGGESVRLPHDRRRPPDHRIHRPE